MSVMKIPIRSDDDPQRGDQRQPAEAEGPPESSISDPALDDPVAPEMAAAEVRLQELEAALAEKTQECDTTRDQLLRLKADFDNYRKRMTRQAEDTRQFATAEFVKDLLPALDNLDRALTAAHRDATPGAASIAAGVEMVLRQFKDALAKVGVREVRAQGQRFDPAQHEAVEMMTVSADDDGKVMAEVQRGYMIHDRLLRPARVVVGKAQQDVTCG
jgi:molecular chaperone GrpE